MFKKLHKFLLHSEWKLSFWQMLFGAGGLLGAFALPAWAVKSMTVFQEFAPLSWVVAGFVGALVAALIYAVVAWSKMTAIKAKYSRNLYERTGFVDPMASTFEEKRIFLEDFVMPSDAYISDKTFVDCEIVGPAILFLRGNYNVTEQRLPQCDAVALNGDRAFHNGIIVENCHFRRCSFKRITLMMLPSDYERYKDLDWLNWVSRPPDPQMEIPFNHRPELEAPQSHEDTGEEKTQ